MPEMESVGVIDNSRKKNNNLKASPSICQNAHASPVGANMGQNTEGSKKGNRKTQADTFVCAMQRKKTRRQQVKMTHASVYMICICI